MVLLCRTRTRLQTRRFCRHRDMPAMAKAFLIDVVFQPLCHTFRSGPRVHDLQACFPDRSIHRNDSCLAKAPRDVINLDIPKITEEETLSAKLPTTITEHGSVIPFKRYYLEGLLLVRFSSCLKVLSTRAVQMASSVELTSRYTRYNPHCSSKSTSPLCPASVLFAE